MFRFFYLFLLEVLFPSEIFCYKFWLLKNNFQEFLTCCKFESKLLLLHTKSDVLANGQDTLLVYLKQGLIKSSYLHYLGQATEIISQLTQPTVISA